MIRWKKIMSLALSAVMAVSAGWVPQMVQAKEYVGKAAAEQSGEDAPPTWGEVPNDEQLHYMKAGLAAFCHFGPNTFNNVEWGENYGDADPSTIFGLREKFDAEGIVKAVKEAGFSRLILTAKHHDGLCLWDTETTTYNVAAAGYPGDILEELSDWCTEYNLDMGCYLSPWDIHEDKYGCFGANNNRENSAGYTDYNELYIAQIHEICTATKKDENGNTLTDENGDPVYKYGNNNPNRRSDRFVEWWMDGAQGSANNQEIFDWKGILGEIHANNPHCQVFGTHAAINGKNGEEDIALASTGGIHWIGNEAGYASDNTWAKVRKGESYEALPRPSGAIEGLADGNQWSVPEVDARILSGWFWTDGANENTLKSEERLAQMYFESVGRGATLLLNLSPNKEGKIAQTQLDRFKQLGQNIKDTFAEDFTKADGVTASASSVWKDSGDYSADNVIDTVPEGETYDNTYWAPAEGMKRGTLTIEFGGEKTFDVVSIEEYIQKGQAISSFSVDYRNAEGNWEKFGSGKTISSKRLCRRAPVTGDAVRISILSAESTPMINNVGVFKAVEGFETDSTGTGTGEEDGDDDAEKIPSNLSEITIPEFDLDASWTKENGDTSAWSNANKEGEASFTFTGTQAWITGTKDPSHGTMDVYIDNEKIASVNTKESPRKMNQLLYVTPELSYGEHTVRMVCTKDAIGLSSAYYTKGEGVFALKQAKCDLLYGKTAEVEIIRTGGSSGEAEISYITESSGAEQGVNYEHIRGSVIFKDGETSKKITLKAKGKTGDPTQDNRLVDGKDFYFYLMEVGDTSFGRTQTHVTCYTPEGWAKKVWEACQAINPEDYEKEGAEEFLKALEELNIYRSSQNASERALVKAAQAAELAKESLVEREGGYTQEDPYEFPTGDKVKTIEAEKFILDASGAKDPNKYVRIGEKDYGTVVDWFEEGNKIKLPFYAETAGDYKVTAHYRSGRKADNPNALNWSGTNVVAGSQDVYGEDNATTNHTAELTVHISETGAGELIFTADEKGGPVIDKFEIQCLESSGEGPDVPVTGVTLNKTELTIGMDTWCGLLTAKIVPENAANKSVTFQSSDPAVAVVDDYGVVKGIKDGSAVITVTTVSGSKTAQCTVTVAAQQETAAYTEAKENLDKAVAMAGEYETVIAGGENHYSEDMKKIFAQALQDAQDAQFAAEDAAPGRINDCAEALKKAQAGLDLDALVTEAEAYVAAAGIYTEESMKAFMAQYNAAKTAISEEGYARATAESLSAIKGAFTEASKKLVKKGAEVKPLNAPTGVKAVSKAAGVEITFSAVANASSYEIYRGNQKIATVTGTSFTDEKAPGGKAITYTVMAVSSDKAYTNSAKSAGVKLTLPKAVTKLKVKAVKGKVKITFKKVGGAKKYMIYRASKKNGPYKKIATLSAKKNSYTDKKAKKGKNFYRVLTVKGKTYSPAAVKSVNVKKK